MELDQAPAKLRHSHWHFLLAHRRRSINKTEQELLVGQLISLLGAIVAGVILDIHKNSIEAVVGVFVILPGVFDLGGAVAGAMGAKINHRLEHHMGQIHHIYVATVVYALCLVATASVFLGLFGGALAKFFFAADFTTIWLVTVLSAVLCSLIGLPLVGAVTILAIKRGHNPDNIIGPIETSIFDSLSVLMVVLVLGWLT